MKLLRLTLAAVLSVGLTACDAARLTAPRGTTARATEQLPPPPPPDPAPVTGQMVGSGG
jgi:hypothetical protein